MVDTHENSCDRVTGLRQLLRLPDTVAEIPAPLRGIEEHRCHEGEQILVGEIRWRWAGWYVSLLGKEDWKVRG